jgi:hypothetical protein
MNFLRNIVIFSTVTMSVQWSSAKAHVQCEQLFRQSNGASVILQPSKSLNMQLSELNAEIYLYQSKTSGFEARSVPTYKKSWSSKEPLPQSKESDLTSEQIYQFQRHVQDIAELSRNYQGVDLNQIEALVNIATLAERYLKVSDRLNALFPHLPFSETSLILRKVVADQNPSLDKINNLAPMLLSEQARMEVANKLTQDLEIFRDKALKLNLEVDVIKRSGSIDLLRVTAFNKKIDATESLKLYSQVNTYYKDLLGLTIVAFRAGILPEFKLQLQQALYAGSEGDAQIQRLLRAVHPKYEATKQKIWSLFNK